MERTQREVVKVGASFIKSVRWNEGSMTAKAVTLTSKLSEAATFLPAHAAVLQKQFGPEARDAAIARRRAAALTASKLFAEAVASVGLSDADMAHMRQLLKGL